MKKPGKIYAPQAHLPGIPSPKVGRPETGKASHVYWMSIVHGLAAQEMAQQAGVSTGDFIAMLIDMAWTSSSDMGRAVAERSNKVKSPNKR